MNKILVMFGILSLIFLSGCSNKYNLSNKLCDELLDREDLREGMNVYFDGETCISEDINVSDYLDVTKFNFQGIWYYIKLEVRSDFTDKNETVLFNKLEKLKEGPSVDLKGVMKITRIHNGTIIDVIYIDGVK